MREVHTISDGALLLHEGVVRESGTARRVENLAEARNAREVDAGSRVVIPAFVDPDTVLVTAGPETPRRSAETSIATASKRRLDGHARLAIEDWVRHGVLALGASTHGAADLRGARKLLTVQQTFQGRPVRIRSVFAPPVSDKWEYAAPQLIVRPWAEAIAQRRLAGVLELDIPTLGASPQWDLLASLARHAVPEGFILRMRSAAPLTPGGQQLLLDSGGVAIIAPGVAGDTGSALLRASCVWVITAAMTAAGQAVSARKLLDEGWAIALGSGYRSAGLGSFNPQYLVHLACEHLGLTIEEALTAYTWNAACSLRMATVAGSLEPGKQADLVVMDLGDYRELSRRAGHNDVIMVMRAGRVVYRRGGLISG